MGGDPGDVHAAAAVLDHEQDEEAAQEDGVDVGEVDGEDRVGLRGQELLPGRAGPSRRGIEGGRIRLRRRPRRPCLRWGGSRRALRMTGQTTGPTLIQSVQRALRLLEMVAEFDGRAQAKELARAAGFTLPTTYHLLRTMTHEGYLQRLDDGGYVLGHRLDVVLRHGRAARAVAQTRPALEWLRDELNSAVYLARYEDGEVVILDIVDSAKAPRIDLWVGIHDAAHATAIGKSILGQLRPDEQEG